ncbi:MAG TPA: hypothetical protein VFO21_25070 [Vicinamibacterales bacterium]|nr:hypothetical protein [Vicinamibacterales bacterium]
MRLFKHASTLVLLFANMAFAPRPAYASACEAIIQNCPEWGGEDIGCYPTFYCDAVYSCAVEWCGEFGIDYYFCSSNGGEYGGPHGVLFCATS